MDPCPFVRLTVGNLALKFPVASKPTRSVIHPSASPCFCKIKLNNFPSQNAVVPLITNNDNSHFTPASATFNLSKADLQKLNRKTMFAGKPTVTIHIYAGRRGSTCGVSSGRFLGKICVPLCLSGDVESKTVIFHNGWVYIGKDANKSSSSAQFHCNVKTEPDPRYVFEFDNEPECSPQVFQVKGNTRQPVFTCEFSFRNTADRCTSTKSWLGSFGSVNERTGKERKGWSITVHDLSGSRVAMASMVTPFVASPGTDRVSRSNPGSWLILRPGDGTWKPWGRLEAWRERGSSDGLGCRFTYIPETGSAGIVLAESSISSRKGGKFVVDLGSGCSPRGSGELGMWPYFGFVMSAKVEGEGKCSKPIVEVSVQHVNYTEDAALFVALAAAVDLSMDACMMFSNKLRKELIPCQDMDPSC